MDLSICGARISQRPRISRPFEREGDPREEAAARALIAEADAEGWEEVSLPEGRKLRDMYKEIKEGTLPRSMVDEILPSPQGSRPDALPPRLPGNLGMFTTQRYAEKHGGVLPPIDDSELDDFVGALAGGGGSQGSLISGDAQVPVSPSATALAQRSVEDAKWQQDAELLRGNNNELTDAQVIKFLKVAGEGFKGEAGNMTAALYREFPEEMRQSESVHGGWQREVGARGHTNDAMGQTQSIAADVGAHKAQTTGVDGGVNITVLRADGSRAEDGAAGARVIGVEEGDAAEGMGFGPHDGSGLGEADRAQYVMDSDWFSSSAGLGLRFCACARARSCVHACVRVFECVRA